MLRVSLDICLDMICAWIFSAVQFCISVSCFEDICCLCLYSVSFSGIFTAVRMFPVVNPVQYTHCEDIYYCALGIYGFNFDLLHHPGCSSLLLFEGSMVRGHSSEGL
jgi:hypothetical protein